jgi:hypothetical protein
MSTHYITCAPIAVLAGFLVVVSQAFTPDVLGWVAFGVAVGVTAICVLAQLDRTRGGVQRTLDGAIVAIATLLVAFSVAASGAAVTWLTFAFALGIEALALTGLTLHEISTWRAQHQLRNLHWLSDPHVDATPPMSHAA